MTNGETRRIPRKGVSEDQQCRVLPVKCMECSRFSLILPMAQSGHVRSSAQRELPVPTRGSVALVLHCGQKLLCACSVEPRMMGRQICFPPFVLEVMGNLSAPTNLDQLCRIWTRLSLRRAKSVIPPPSCLFTRYAPF
jgi:hypothetical protein